MTTCGSQCDDGYVPIDGEADKVEGERLLLIPTDWATCICNPLWAVNDDIALPWVAVGG